MPSYKICVTMLCRNNTLALQNEKLKNLLSIPIFFETDDHTYAFESKKVDVQL